MPEEDAWRSMWHKYSARCAPAPSGPIRATSTPEDVGARPAPGARRRLHSSPVEPTDVEPAGRPERVVKIIDNASNNTFDLEERQLRRNFHRNSRHQSASVFAAFGRLGLASLAMVICVTLVLGTVVVWWSTGVETQPVVGCLVGLFQADYSTQVGDKLEAMLTEAHNSLELTLAATLILSNSTDDPGALLATLFSPPSANRSNAAELVDGSYFGVWMDANSSTLHREVRAPDGCLERDGVVLACDWQPESQVRLPHE
ncbi:hypothetical protein AB1Y20_002235 [Prymnesium parvum]|uniref:Uncharacterized protein n=1 Tax=Prymnesium parvum TaxID=97485 RepID=A0AB34JAD4_PRYPA